MNNSSILTARNLQVNLGRHTILKDINVSMHAGQLLTVLGGNGAGKSTLLRALAQQSPYQKGRVTLKGQLLEKWSVGKLAQERAVLSQYSTLVFPMSVIDVVLLGRYPFSQGAPTTKDWAVVEDLMEYLGILKYAHKNILNLSGGEQQRVALCRAFAIKPKILFADEPTANLDSLTAKKVLDQMFELQQTSDCSMLIATHDQELANRCDHTIRLENGKLVAGGLR